MLLIFSTLIFDIGTPSGLRIVRAEPRNIIRAQATPIMSTDLRPPGVWLPLDVDERDFVRVTYEDVLEAGETLSSVHSVTCQAITGTDAAASSRLIGAPDLDSPIASQLMADVEDGVDYLVRFLVNTSNGRRLLGVGTILGTRVGGPAP